MILKFLRVCRIRLKRRYAYKRSQGFLAWIVEFSKKIVALLALLYCLQTAYALAKIESIPDSTALSTLITEFNETFRICIGGYLLKAGFENIVKLKAARIKKKENIGGYQEDG